MTATDPQPLDLSGPLRDAVLAAPQIAGALDQWAGEPAVFTRVPVPAEAGYPMIVIPTPSAIGDMDGLTSPRPIIMRNIAIYGLQPEHYRTVEGLGYLIRDLFHRQKWAITPEGYDVIDIVCSGPIPGPTDDDKEVARIVGLTIRLRRKP